MNIELEEINNRSLTNIFFDRKEDPIFIESLSYINLIFSGTGIFLVLKSNFGLTYEKIKQSYQNLSLRNYDFDWMFTPFLPKAPKEIFIDILECFKYVVDKTKDEMFIIVYFDTKNKKFIMDILKIQIVTGSSVEYAYNKNYEMNDRYVKYLEIHSHNTMSAGFSTTDNRDESGRTMYFCGVLGKINEHSNIYNVEQKFRIWTGEKFRDICPWEVFDHYIVTPAITHENKKQLDKIIEISKIVTENKKQSLKSKNQRQIDMFNPEIPLFDGYDNIYEELKELEAPISHLNKNEKTQLSELLKGEKVKK